MDLKYSYKKAAAWAGAGLGTSLLAGIYQAVSHHASGHFATLSESFTHVAQPEAIVGALAASALFGAFMEFTRSYYNSLENQELKQAKPDKDPSLPHNDI